MAEEQLADEQLAEELTNDQKRLLLVISRFSEPAQSQDDTETWIKRIPLMSLVNRGIRMGVFTEYDFAPMLVEYMGQMRYANISRGGMDDIIDLRERGLVDRLKLATSHHVYISAYKITPFGVACLQGLAEEHHEAVGELLSCKACGTGTVEMESREAAPYLICKDCGKEEQVPIFDIEKIPYVSSPVFSNIWLPPD